MEIDAFYFAARGYDTGGRFDSAPTRMSASTEVTPNGYLDPGYHVASEEDAAVEESIGAW